MPSAKRKKKEEDEEAQTPLSEANEKTDGRFVADYLQTETSGWITSWTHPHEQRQYGIRLARSARVDEASLQACFRLVEHTSRDDYERSRGRWKPAVKLAEMRLPDLRYLLVTDAAGAVRGFTSLMPTYEAGRPVVYCYEIHLADELQG